MNFEDDIPSIPIDNFKGHYLLLDLTSMQDATEMCFYVELVGESLRLEPNFTYPLEHGIELIVFGKRLSSVAVDKFSVVEKKSQTETVSLQQLISGIPFLKYRYLGSFPFDYVPFLSKEAFAFIKKTQHSNMEGQQSIMIANSRHKLFIADSLGRASFFKQKYKQMMPQPPKSLVIVGGFCTIFSVFHLFKF